MPLRPRQLLNTCLHHKRCTRLLPLTPCTFLARTLRTNLRQAPSSPRCKCRLCPPQASWSLANTLGMLLPRKVLNTCLLHMRCIRLVPLTPCTFLVRTLCTNLRQAPSIPHCKCRLCSPDPSWSLTNSLGMSIRLRPRQLWNTCLRHMGCIRLILLTPCTILPRTLCTGIH